MILTARLVEPFLHRLELRLELLVLQHQAAVRFLQERLEVLYPLIASEQLALRDPRLLLQGRVLVYELKIARRAMSQWQLTRPWEAPAYLLLHDG